MPNPINAARRYVHRYRRWRQQREQTIFRHRLLPPNRLRPIIARNRKSLAQVAHWIDDEVYQQSIFHYGLPAELRHLVDQPQGESCTYVDAMQLLSTRLHGPVHYLEIGVSVGKTFWQMLHGLPPGSQLTGFDIENISPRLLEQLEPVSDQQWAGPKDSLRKKPSRDQTYRFAGGDQSVRYLAADVFDEAAWKRLHGQQFNVIFSDAFHSPDALRFEHEMLLKYDLIDPDQCLILWDDLHGQMRTVWSQICGELCERFNVAAESTFVLPLRGWLGENYEEHPIGFFMKLKEQ